MPMMPTYDFETEADAIKRKQAIADAMQASALRPMEMPTQPGVKVSPIAVLGKMLEGYVAGKKSDEVKSERTALSQRYGDELRSGMEQYYKTMQGYETPSMALAPNADGSPQMVKVPGDRKKAIFDALASNHPVLRDLAMSQLKEEGKDQLTPKDLLSIATPESVLANPANPAAWKPKRDLKAFAPGEVLLDSSGNYATPGNPSGQRPFDLKTIGGDLYQTSATGYKKLDNAPKVSVGGPIVNLPKGQSKLFEGRAEAANKDLAEAEQVARAGQATLSAINRMRQVNNTYQGPTAGIAMRMGQLAKAMGVPVDEKRLANSETFESESAQIWLQAMNLAGGARGLVKEESERIAQAVPNLIHTQQGREQLFAMLEARVKESQELVKLKQRAMQKAATADNPNLYFEELANLGGGTVPSVPGNIPSNPGPIPLDQYLKNFGGR